MSRTLLASAALALVLSAASAQAQTLSFGVTLTSDYISRGATQTNFGAALQPWIEYETNGFYLGAWASNVDLGPDNVELDLYGGYRWSQGDLSLDVGYARYLYDSTGDAGGELYFLAEQTIGASTTAFAGFYLGHAGGFSFNDGHVGMSTNLFTNLDGSFKVGYAGGSVYAEAGVTYTVNDRFSVDARAYRSDFQGPRYVLSTSFSF